MENLYLSSINFIKKNFWRFIIFSCVGATSALVHMLFFNLFRSFLSLTFTYSVVFPTCCALVYNFSVNRNITFRANGHGLKKQIFKFLIVYLISISVNFLVTFSLESALGPGFWQENISTLSGIIASIPFSFLGSLLWVFKKEE
ncbi:MAG: GtrA family protein [Candidatus Pacearchaeota archaeon]